jgi:hypothetical protein
MNEVLIPYGDDASETARKLLDAAPDPLEIRHQPDDGGFLVPEDVAVAAGFGEPDEPEASEQADSDPEPKQAPKKRTAKKSTAKKSAKKPPSKE